MPSNDKTELLCHTWKFQKGEIIDESLVPDEEKESLLSAKTKNLRHFTCNQLKIRWHICIFQNQAPYILGNKEF